MADTTGSAALLGAGNPGDPNTGAGQTGNPAPQSKPASGGSWLDGIEDPDIKGWATKKEWKSPADALLSHRELEKRFSGEKVVVPKGEDDKIGWEAFFKAGGRPDSPDGYELDKLEGLDPNDAKAVAAKLHELGLSAMSGKKLAAWMQEQRAEQAARADEDFRQRSAADLADIRREWGGAYTAKEEAARRGVMLAGLNGEALEKIERSIGTKEMYRVFAEIGQRIGEAPAHGAQQGGASAYMTPAEADAKLLELQGDRDWSKRFTEGGVKERAEFDRLLKISVSGG